MTVEPRPGDFCVIETGGTVARLIRLFERWARENPDPEVFANHAVVYVGHGVIVEANPSGVAFAPLSKYDGRHLLWSTGLGYEAEFLAEVVDVACGMVGIPYGFPDIAAFLLDMVGLLPRWARKRLNRPDRLICSQAVARCYRVAQIRAIAAREGLTYVMRAMRDDGAVGLIPGKTDSQVTPDDLACLILRGGKP